MGKVLISMALLLAAVLAGGAWWLYNSLDSVVASAIRSYGPEITGVTVKLQGVKIQPAQGMASINGLQLGNPAGFKTPQALALGGISMELDVASLTKDVVLIKKIVIDQPSITYEHQSGGSNLEVIQRHIERAIAEKTGSSKAAQTGSKEKKFIIDRLSLRRAKAAVSTDWMQGKSMEVSLPDLHLADIGKKAGGATGAEVAKQVVGAMTQSIKTAPGIKLDGVVDGVKKGAAGAVDAVKGFFK